MENICSDNWRQHKRKTNFHSLKSKVKIRGSVKSEKWVNESKMIMIQQQVYPHFNSPGAVVKREGATSSPTSVIKETESVRNLSIREHERQRSPSPAAEEMEMVRHTKTPPTSATAKVITATGAAASATVSVHKFDMQRFIKRSNSADYDDYQYEDQIIKQSEDECHDRQYDSEPEANERDRYECNNGTRYTTDDEDLPLDLSLPSERRRTRTYSDTESDDSAGIGDDKVGGKAAYKKSLMKRYCKYIADEIVVDHSTLRSMWIPADRNRYVVQHVRRTRIDKK